ncbi:MAG: Fic family protein [Bacteroidales bacterium]|nr:Fic family protein [Bacteroidales bacterium]
MKELNKLYEKWMSLQPLSEKQQDILSKKFTVEYNYNSNHIEGNTLTYGQTELLLMFGTVSGENHLHDFVEMKASQVGLKMMSEEVKAENMPLTQNFIRTLHKTLLREDYTVYRNLPGGVTTSFIIHAGQYKTRPNSVITRYGDRFEYASPEETPALMTSLVDWYNKEEKRGKLSPVELAALFHYRYIRIHPFEDGNGRIARLLVNYIFSRHNWPMIVVRSRNKNEYLEALHQTDMLVGTAPSDGAAATISQIEPFLKYFKELVKRELQYNISFVEKSGENIWWYDGQQLEFRSPNVPKLLSILQQNPSITYAELSKELGINTSAVQKLLTGLKEKGYIQRRNHEKMWYVSAVSSLLKA